MRIFGHQKILNFLDKSVEKNTLAQAYLFTGPEHVGKFTVALNYAQKLTGRTDKVNPDIIILAPEIEEKKGVVKKKDIKVEQIRVLQKDLSFAPYFGKYKIALIDEADRLTVAAQNALLKTLEEPNEKNILILIAQNNEKILPTIKSRCVVKKFNLVGRQEIAEMIGPEKNKEELIFWALGRPGLARAFASDGEAFLNRRRIGEEFEQMIRGGVNGRFFRAEDMSKDVSATVEKLELWLVLLRKNILNGAGAELSPEKSLYLAEKIGQSLAVLKETNANVRLVLENLFLAF